MLDPLEIFLRNTFQRRGLTPMPLVSTDHEVVIASGLAVVTTHRLFRNVEPVSIEAVLTFPLPVHATLFELTADIDGRTLRADALERAAARRTYEDAVERGKSAVLHEEVLRGVHMISVANIRPGGDIKITTKWTQPMSVVAGRATLRIPQTVGDVYGRSTLSDADAIRSGGPEQPVMISIRAAGNVEVVGASLVAGHARLKNAAPIDIIAELWEPRSIIGNSRGGQAVALTLSPEPAGRGALSLAVLVDHSGSMAGRFGDGRSATAHDAAKQAVLSLAARLEANDFIDLWEFDHRPRHVGSVGGETLADDGRSADLFKLAFALSPPRGGTEIGRAIDAVLGESRAKDVLVITDGLSEALDVQRLARAGRRISVVLIGENSLEAKIGHLAALTGGDIFIVTADDLEQVARAAIDCLRRRNVPLPPIAHMPERLECVRNNVRMNVQWSPAAADAISPEVDRAAVAIATSLILSCAMPELAGKAAAAEGVVSHLTSLVLVDEAGVSQEALPAFRKVPLAATNAVGGNVFGNPRRKRMMDTSSAFTDFDVFGLPAFAFSLGGESGDALRLPDAVPQAPKQRVPLSASEAADRVNRVSRDSKSPLPPFKAALMQLAYQIDWEQSSDELILGNLSALPGEVREAIIRLAAIREIFAFAAHNELIAEVVAIGLLARALGTNDNVAKNVWLTIAGRLKGGPSASFWELEDQINARSYTATGP